MGDDYGRTFKGLTTFNEDADFNDPVDFNNEVSFNSEVSFNDRTVFNSETVLEKVSAVPSYDSERDLARIVFNTSDNRAYVGDSTAFQSVAVGVTDVPSGTILLIESNVAITGYELLIDYDDVIVYISKGSNAGGQPAGEGEPSFGSDDWTDITNHTHPTGNFTLTEAHVPNHTHTGGSHNHSLRSRSGTINNTIVYAASWASAGDTESATLHLDTGAINFSNIGALSSFGNGQAHNHGTTSVDPGLASFRPEGRVFTRQKRF